MFSLFIFKKTAVFIWWEFLSWYTNHFLSKESFLFIYELFNEGSKGWTAKCSDELFQSNCQKDYFWKFKYFILMKRKNKHHSIWFIYNRCKEIKNRRRTQDQYVFDGSYLFIMNKWIEEEEVDLSDILHIGLTDEEKKEQKMEEKQEIQKPIVFLKHSSFLFIRIAIQHHGAKSFILMWRERGQHYYKRSMKNLISSEFWYISFFRLTNNMN